jgi:hypothetical protein
MYVYIIYRQSAHRNTQIQMETTERQCSCAPVSVCLSQLFPVYLSAPMCFWFLCVSVFDVGILRLIHLFVRRESE